tara:strand:+ start:21425 stop:21601 length:177 start_codon:yes stop_codon:yes gene_type:complete
MADVLIHPNLDFRTLCGYRYHLTPTVFMRLWARGGTTLIHIKAGKNAVINAINVSLNM